MRRLIAAALCAATAGLAVEAVGAPASAAAGVMGRTSENPHCVVAAVPAGSSVAPAAPLCFATFAESIARATRGAVRLPAGASTVTQQQLDAGYAKARASGRAPAGSVVIGISYGEFQFTGATTTHETPSGCDADSGREWEHADLSALGLNNIISSARGFSGCQGLYYEFFNFQGAVVGTDWTGGVMNNSASSIGWI